MPIEVKLQTERTPGRYTQKAQTELLVNKVKVVMEAFGRIRSKEGHAGLLVVPRLKGRAGFHGRKDMDESWVSSAYGEDGLDAIFFAEGFDLPDKFNG